MKTRQTMAVAVVGIMAMIAFLPMLSSAQEAGAVANVGTNTSIVTVPAYNNPVLVNKSCEPSMIYNASQGWIDVWFTGGATYGASGGYIYLWYTHTTNANYTAYTTPVRVMQNIRFPYVVQYDGIFYCFAHNSSAITGNLYMWTSHDKVTWTIANGGKAVLHHSATTSSLRYWMANPAVILVDGVWHMWIECGNSSANTTNWNYFGIAYSYSRFGSSLNFTTNMSSSMVIGGGTGAPFAQYVADRNAALLVYHQLTSATLARETTATASMSRNLALASSYTKHTGFVIGIVTQVTADWTWAITPTGLVFQIFHDQPSTEDIYQGSIALNLDQFYDAIGGRDYTTMLPANVHQYVVLVVVMFSLVLVMPVIGLAQVSKDKGISKENVIELVVFEVVGLVLLGFLVVFLGPV